MAPFTVVFFLLFSQENIIGTKSDNTFQPDQEISGSNLTMGHLPHTTFLGPDGKYHLSWDFTDTHATFEVLVETRGYIGLGLSPNGGMPGSDVVIAWVDDVTGEAHVTDRYAVEKSEPRVDPVQDAELLHGSQNETHTVIRFRRLLELCDNDDRSIKGDTVRVIWAYHSEDPDVDGHATYHGRNRGVKSIILLNPPKVPPKRSAAMTTFDLVHKQVKIPAKDTVYLCRSFEVPKFDRKQHLIAVDPVLQEGHESYVHHIVVLGCYHEVSESSVDVEHECNHSKQPQDWRGCFAMLLAWGTGGGSILLPEHVGMPFGVDSDPTLLLLEVHYENPLQKADIVDSSGLRLFFTSELRTHDGGLLGTGTVPRPTQLIPPYEEDFVTPYPCFPECLQEAMSGTEQEIRVVGAFMHTHLAGSAVRIRHFRQGTELEPIAEDMHYDFNLQQYRLMENAIAVRSGDHLVTECHYNSSQRTNVTVGGPATTDEMCLGFLLYYPKIPLNLCLSFPRPSFLAKFTEIEVLDNWIIRSPESLANQNLVPMLDNLIDWGNETVRKAFQMLLTMREPASYLSRCLDGQRQYPSDLKAFAFPEILVPLPKDRETHCRVTSFSSQVKAVAIYVILLASTVHIFNMF